MVYFALGGNSGWVESRLRQLPPDMAVIVLLPLLLFLWRPEWLLGVINWALRKVRRPRLAYVLTRGVLITALGLALLDWLLWGLTFAAFAFALLPPHAIDLVGLAPHLVAAYAIGNAVGFLSVITPSGIGVREKGNAVCPARPSAEWRGRDCHRIGGCGF